MQRETDAFISPRKGKFLNYFLPIFPIINQYIGPFVTWGITILVIYSVICLVRYKKMYFYKPLLGFILVAVVMQVISILRLSSDVTQYNTGNLLMILCVIFIITLTVQEIDLDLFYKVYRIIGIIVLIGLFYQAFIYYVLNMSLTPLMINATEIISDTKLFYVALRPSSFFSEPSAMCQMLLPLLYLALIKKEKILSSAIVVGCFLSTSSIGIVLSIIMVAIYIIVVNKKIALKFIFGTVAIFVVFFVLFSSSDFSSNYAINKILSINILDDVRISRGFQIYMSFPIEEKLFGVGLGGVANYLINDPTVNFDWMSLTKSAGWGYSNSIAGSFLYWGVFGGIMYIGFLFSFIKHINKEISIFYIPIIILVFVAQFMFDTTFLFYIMILLAIVFKSKKIKHDLIIIRI